MIFHNKKIGLIAGRGKLPLLLAKRIKKTNVELIIINLLKQKEKELQTIADRFYTYQLGQVQTIIDTLLREGIKEIFMIGKVDKKIIFDKTKLDTKASAILDNLKYKDDNAIMKAIVDELEQIGIKVLAQTYHLSDLLAKEGVLTNREPDVNQWQDIEYGLLMAKKIASLNIGQVVVVQDRTVLAVEAVEGTDETILRAGRLGQEGMVVAKVSKPDHDIRFDIPTIGLSTIKTMIKAKANVLAMEAEKVLMVDKDEMIKQADKAEIIIVAV